MENNNENKGFQYTYSAKEQAELKRIREKYAPATEVEDKMERLRRLDASVTQKAQAVALIFGVIGALILGAGMSLCMSDFAEILGSYRDMAMVIGIPIGLIGGVLAALAYPMYNVIVKRERKKIAPEIIRLTDELMK
jgi:F0F1-type ATP synthase assembly protein I